MRTLTLRLAPVGGCFFLIGALGALTLVGWIHLSIRQGIAVIGGRFVDMYAHIIAPAIFVSPIFLSCLLCSIIFSSGYFYTEDAANEAEFFLMFR